MLLSVLSKRVIHFMRTRSVEEIIPFDLKGYEALEPAILHRFSGHPRFRLGHHGYAHWLSVYDNAKQIIDLLGKELPDGFPLDTTLLAAYLHDTGRRIDRRGIWKDLHHSARSEKFLREFLPLQDIPWKPEQVDNICFLARAHFEVNDLVWQEAKARNLYLPLQIVRDADALDRIRFFGLDESFLHLPVSHTLVPYVEEKWKRLWACEYRPR